MSTAISIRLPDAWARESDHIAKETERPRSFHIRKALESYIEDFADVQIALDRLRDQTVFANSGSKTIGSSLQSSALELSCCGDELPAPTPPDVPGRSFSDVSHGAADAVRCHRRRLVPGMDGGRPRPPAASLAMRGSSADQRGARG